MRETTLRGAAAVAALAFLLPAPPAAAADACSAPSLAAQVIAHELEASRSAAPYMFREMQQTRTGSRTREVVEGSGFRIRRLIARDGQELSPDDRASEAARLQRLVTDADAADLRQQRREDGERMRELLQAAPQAFVFDCRDAVTLPSGETGIRLGFKPNPMYQPAKRSLRVLTGMVGTMLVDPRAARVISLDATLVRDVDFGWGILGRLYRGGRVSLRQKELAPNYWAVKRLEVHFDGRLLLLKPLHIDSVTTMSGYRVLSPDITWRRGVKLLLSGR